MGKEVKSQRDKYLEAYRADQKHYQQRSQYMDFAMERAYRNAGGRATRQYHDLVSYDHRNLHTGEVFSKYKLFQMTQTNSGLGSAVGQLKQSIKRQESVDYALGIGSPTTYARRLASEDFIFITFSPASRGVNRQSLYDIQRQFEEIGVVLHYLTTMVYKGKKLFSGVSSTVEVVGRATVKKDGSPIPLDKQVDNTGAHGHAMCAFNIGEMSGRAGWRVDRVRSNVVRHFKKQIKGRLQHLGIRGFIDVRVGAKSRYPVVNISDGRAYLAPDFKELFKYTMKVGTMLTWSIDLYKNYVRFASGSNIKMRKSSGILLGLVKGVPKGVDLNQLKADVRRSGRGYDYVEENEKSIGGLVSDHSGNFLSKSVEHFGGYGDRESYDANSSIEQQLLSLEYDEVQCDSYVNDPAYAAEIVGRIADHNKGRPLFKHEEKYWKFTLAQLAKGSPESVKYPLSWHREYVMYNYGYYRQLESFRKVSEDKVETDGHIAIAEKYDLYSTRSFAQVNKYIIWDAATRSIDFKINFNSYSRLLWNEAWTQDFADPPVEEVDDWCSVDKTSVYDNDFI